MAKERNPAARKNPGGRPRKPSAERLSVQLRFSARADEARIIKQAAQVADQTVPAWLRQVAVGAAKRKPKPSR